MTHVCCSNRECFFCDERHICRSNYITVNEYGVCDVEAEYTEVAPEYQNEFWIKCQCEEGGEITRRLVKGFRYEYRGLVLYTTDNIRDGIDNVSFTEEKTGMRRGNLKTINEMYDKLIETREKEPPVMDYPICQEVCGNDDDSNSDTEEEYPF